MALSWYNYFSPKIRESVAKPLREAIDRGELSFPHICVMCGLTGGSHSRPGDRGIVPYAKLIYHLEDYSKPLEPYEVCVECHMRLHKRFTQPNRWISHLYTIRKHPARPFRSTSEYFMATRGERSDIPATAALAAFTPRPSKWYEMLSLNPALGQPPAEHAATSVMALPL